MWSPILADYYWLELSIINKEFNTVTLVNWPITVFKVQFYFIITFFVDFKIMLCYLPSDSIISLMSFTRTFIL